MFHRCIKALTSTGLFNKANKAPLTTPSSSVRSLTTISVEKRIDTLQLQIAEVDNKKTSDIFHLLNIHSQENKTRIISLVGKAAPKDQKAVLELLVNADPNSLATLHRYYNHGETKLIVGFSPEDFQDALEKATQKSQNQLKLSYRR